MKAVNVASRKLFFKDVQPKDDEPLATLLLLHGAGGSHLSWRRQIDKLSDRFRIISIDLPGHGMSEGSGEVTIGAYSRCVAALMDMLELKNVMVGGHSMGGAIALDLALKKSDRLKSLLLIGSGARLHVLPAIFSVIREDYKLAIQGLGNLLFGLDAPVELVNEEKQLLGKVSPDLLLKDFTACDSFDMMDKLGTITVPTLIVCGKQDRLTPAKFSEFMHQKLFNSEIVLFDKCGHMAMLEKSSEFNLCVSSFLAKLQ
jgi:pimeloyl-ACP methyl ester carboxylesterase